MKVTPLKQRGKRYNERRKLDDFWSKAVKKRDGWECMNQNCNHIGYYTEKEMNAHHIVSKGSHPELRYDIDNGITLCPFCHSLIESGNLEFEWNGRLIE